MIDGLESAPDTFSPYTHIEYQNSEGELLEDLRVIAKKAGMLMNTIPHPTDGYSCMRDLLVRQADDHAHQRGEYEGLPKTVLCVERAKHTDFQGATALRRASEAGHLMEAWVNELIEGRDGRSLSSGWPDDWNDPKAEQWLIGRKLPESYERHFESRFSIAHAHGVGRQVTEGPGLRFVGAAIQGQEVLQDGKPFGAPCTPAAIETIWKR